MRVAVALRAGESIDTATRMLNRFPVFYQGDVHQPRVRFARETSAGSGA